MYKRLFIIPLSLACCYYFFKPNHKPIDFNVFVKSQVAMLQSPKGSCSGEQVIAPSGIKYILTAGHCEVLQNNSNEITVTIEDGVPIQRRVIAVSPSSDLMLLEGVPNAPGLLLGSEASQGDEVALYGHRRGYNTYIKHGDVIGEEPVQMIDHDMPEIDDGSCVLPKYKHLQIDTFFGKMNICILDLMENALSIEPQPGMSGGPVVDYKNQLVGVISAGGDGLGFMVKLQDIKEFLKGY